MEENSKRTGLSNVIRFNADGSAVCSIARHRASPRYSTMRIGAPLLRWSKRDRCLPSAASCAGG